MMQRSPPTTPNTLTSPMYNSEPNFVASSDSDRVNITQRRRRDDEVVRTESLISEMKSMFSELVTNQTKQNNKMDDLQTALEDIRLQNTYISKQNLEIRMQNEEIRKTISFLSEKYDNAVLEITNLKAECNNNQKTIKALEYKLDSIEKYIRVSSIEIRNMPSSHQETRDTLIAAVQKLGDITNNTVMQTDIKNIFRLKSTSVSVGTVIVEFSCPTIKERFLKYARNFNKLQNNDKRLNTTHLQANGPQQPIYVSEVLTVMTKRLHYLAREFIKSSNYQQCWTANGKVYVRERDGMPSQLIKSEDDIAKLRRQK